MTESALKSLSANLAAFILPPLALNGIIFSLGWDGGSSPQPYLPPGWAVGTIWMLLFTGLGVARWLLLRTGQPGGLRAARMVVLLAFLCLIYPLYTGGLSNDRVGLIGTVLTALITVWVLPRLVKASRPAAALIGLLLGWLVYASVAQAIILRVGGNL